MNVDLVFRILGKEVEKYDVPVIDLIEVQTSDPFKVLVGTMLSAQTKDEVTSKACERLFQKVKKIKDFDKFSLKQIEKLIYPVSFYHNKAGYLKQLPSLIDKVPGTIDELVKLPGVGRKTANLVVSVAFGGEGLCVDTHCHRISNRLGWVKTKTPFQTEMALRKVLLKKYWHKFNLYFVAYGQNICRPLSPWCSKCVIKDYCKRVGVVKSR
jgi:endonuclease-3